jgi:hypothetical protein
MQCYAGRQLTVSHASEGLTRHLAQNQRVAIPEVRKADDTVVSHCVIAVYGGIYIPAHVICSLTERKLTQLWRMGMTVFSIVYIRYHHELQELRKLMVH